MEREGTSSLALLSGPAETASNRLTGGGGEGLQVLTEGGGERISQVHPCHLGPQRHLPAFDRDIHPYSTETLAHNGLTGGGGEGLEVLTEGISTLALPPARSSHMYISMYLY